MSARAATGWQTSLADLSLILFMVAASAACRLPDQPAATGKPAATGRQAIAAPTPQAEPLAVYVDAPDAPPMRQWLMQQGDDPRLRLTVTAYYSAAPDSLPRALEAAGRLARAAGAAGRTARIVVERGDRPAQAALAFDAAAD